MLYEISYTIPGKKTRIYATKEVEVNRYVGFPSIGSSVTIDKKTFYVNISGDVERHRPGKLFLHSDRLLTKKTKQPLRSAPMVMKFFKELAASGWTIENRDAFVRENFPMCFQR